METFQKSPEKLLQKLPKTHLKTAYIKENYSFTFFSDDEFTFLVMTDLTTSKSKSYAFLDELANTFYEESGKTNNSNWNAEFTLKLKNLMVNINNLRENKSFKGKL